MKVIFSGTPEQIKKEMVKWLNTFQLQNTELESDVISKLNQHSITISKHHKDTMSLSLVKDTMPLHGSEWKEFITQLEKCGVTRKRVSSGYILTHLRFL